MAHFEPRDPDTYFPIINELRAQAAELQDTLLAEASKIQVDTFGFFEGIRPAQIQLTESQQDVHRDVLSIEARWADAKTIRDSHRQYREAVEFFGRKEREIGVMTEMMENLSCRVAELPRTAP
jgi:hypothetical protein